MYIIRCYLFFNTKIIFYPFNGEGKGRLGIGADFLGARRLVSENAIQSAMMRTDSEASAFPERSGSVKRHRLLDSSSIVAAATGPIIRGQLSLGK